MENVLIAGGSGFIGSHLVNLIATQGHSLLNLDVQHPQIAGQDAFWRTCDIKDLQALASIFDDFQPTRVIHLPPKPI